jgi:nucleotide-binding universal stress UspA family protein
MSHDGACRRQSTQRQAEMFKTILVPLDGSILAEQALAPAAELARRTDANVILVRAPNMEPAYATAGSAYGLIYPEQSVGQASAEARDYLKSIQTSRAARGGSVRTVVAEGDPAGAIVDVASQAKADIIVMSSHGHTGLTRWLLGSVAEKVLRAAGCPVLVVRSQRAIQRVLITLDGSELSGQALAPAFETAAALGASVTLLRVVRELHTEELRGLDQFKTGLGQRLVQEIRDDAEYYLRNVIEAFDGLGPQINHEVRSGPAANAILEYAENHAIDLIAMATHGRTGLRRWVYGSVTEKVLRAADYSMLVVRPRADALN